MCSPSCTPWMLALKGTGNICTRHQHSLSTRFLRSSHVSHGPLLTGTSPNQEEEGPGEQVMENRNMTWCHLFIVLTRMGKAEVGLGRVNVVKTPPPPSFPLQSSRTTSVPVLLHLSHEYGISDQSRPIKSSKSNPTPACPLWAGAKALTVYYKALVLLL